MIRRTESGRVYVMSFSETISPFFGRCAFVWFYLSCAMDILGDWRGIAADLGAKHVPIPPLVLLLALVLIFMGCISLLFGYQTRHGAVMLFAMTIVATFALHDFWHYGQAPQRAVEFGIFIRDLAICGGLLLLVGLGPGPFAVDNGAKPGGKRR
jgi:putative oxidoreductase